MENISSKDKGEGELAFYFFNNDLRIDFDENNRVEFIELLGGVKTEIQATIYGDYLYYGRMKMKKIEKYIMPFGIVGVIAYLTHTTLGRLLWSEYNPITTDISSLTAVGAPNRNLLMIFTGIYGIATMLFVIGMIMKSFRKYKWGVRTGWIILLVMNIVSMVGYSAFPLTGDKTQMNFQNMMHIVVTVIVVFLTVISGYVLAFGYLKQERDKNLGFFTLAMAIIITITGALNPIGMTNNLNILGLTERAVIYSLQFMMFVFSVYYTFSPKEES